MWHGPAGMTLQDIRMMHVQKRKWWFERIAEQKKKEYDAAKKANGRKVTGGTRRSRR